MNKSVSKNQQLSGQLAVLFAAFLWSTSGLFIKLLDWHPVVIAGARSFVAALFLLVVRLISPPPKGVKNRAFPLWACGFAFAFTLLTYVVANKLTTAANVILLQYSAPIWAALLAWALLKEKPGLENWIALVFVMFGLFIFMRESMYSGAFSGNTLAIISGVLYGIHSVYLRMMKDGNPSDGLLLGHALTAVMSIPFMIMYPPVLKISSFISILYMGIFQMGLASLLFSNGIKRIKAIKAMLTAILDPILNPVWVLAITGEKPSLSALAGGAIIIIAVIGSSLVGARKNEIEGNQP